MKGIDPFGHDGGRMMLEKNAMETMRARHSVRKYLDKLIPLP